MNQTVITEAGQLKYIIVQPRCCKKYVKKHRRTGTIFTERHRYARTLWEGLGYVPCSHCLKEMIAALRNVVPATI